MVWLTIIAAEVPMADKSKLGMEFPVHPFTVEQIKIAEFAAAVAQKDDTGLIKEIYLNADAAQNAGYRNIPIPPTFPTGFAFWALGGMVGIVNAVGADAAKLLHSEEEYEYFAPICAGDVVTFKMKVADIYERGKKERKGWYFEITVLETEVFNQKGELVMRARTTFMER
jgi:N-terminal half of MaoC dehydratase